MGVLLCGSGSARAQETGGYDEGIFELFVQRFPERPTLLTLVDGTGRVLVPLRPVLDFVGIPVASRGDSLVLEWPPQVWRTVLHPSSRTVATGDLVDTVPPGEWLTRAGEHYLSAAALRRVLAARVDVDWASLSVVVSERDDFPALRSAEREARRARERLDAERWGPQAHMEVPYPARSGGAVAQWGATLVGADGRSRTGLRAAAGVSVLGAAVEGGGTVDAGAGAEGAHDGYLRVTRVFPGLAWVRQAQLGTVLSEGPVARRLTGVTLTNEPYTTPRFFSEVLVEPQVPAGWEYEIYQGESLVGVSTSDRGDVRAPLNYGNNPVTIRMIGPAGQEREERLVYVVPASQLPEGALRYHAGLGRCRDLTCRSYGYGDVRWGLSRRATVGAGVDRIDPMEGAPRTRPFFFVGAAPGTGLTTTLQVQPGAMVRGDAQLLTARSGSFSASGAWYRPAGDAPVLDGWSAHVSGSLPVARLGGRTVSGRIHVRGEEGGGVDSWQASVASTVRRSYVSADLEAGLQRRTILAARAFTTLGGGWHRWLQDLAVTTGVGASRRGAEFLELGASFRPVESGNVAVDVRVRRGAPAMVSIGYTARRALGYLQGRAATGAGTSVFLSGDGGVAWDREVGVVPLPFQSLGRAGLRGSVFHDVDGDGERDPGEPAAGGVDVMVGGERVTTDEGGDFHTWEVRPYDAVEVAVDSLSIDPSWVPARRRVLLRASPNLFNELALPLLRTREVTGSLASGDTVPRRLAGVRVEVRDTAGDLVAVERTFSDGVFYFPRIRPGRYTLAVAASSLEALGLAGAGPTLSFEVEAGTDAPVELPPLALMREGAGRP